MTEHFWLGIGVILLSGAVNGSFPLPMKYARVWRWENTWLVFALTALLILPCALAMGSVPNLVEVYKEVPGRILLYPLLFGFLWGIAQTTFGVGLKALGMALAFSVVSGLGALVGSLLPLLIQDAADLFRPRGLFLLASIPILLVGLYLYARAGREREGEQPAAPATAAAVGMSFAAGLAICIFTGVVGPSWNLGFSLSGEIIRRSLLLGATPVTSVYAVWPLILCAGFIPNLLYCLYLLFRRRTWRLFVAQGCIREMLLSGSMGLLWLSGIVIYGVGATLVGRYGTSVGFAAFVSAQILASNTLGIVAGEWKATSPRTRRLLTGGVAAIVASVIVLSLGGLF
jgi:L-rhamnose-H+ transport protein